MNDQQLGEKLKALDKIELKTSWSNEELWDAIESKLPEQKKRHLFLPIGRSALPWAAMVLFSLGMYWWFSTSSSNSIEIVEIEVETDPVVEIDNNDQLAEGKSFIQEACQKELDICASPSFVILYEELSRIEEEKMLLSEAVNQYGADEIATRALIQLENAESSITSQLVAMIVI